MVRNSINKFIWNGELFYKLAPIIIQNKETSENSEKDNNHNQKANLEQIIFRQETQFQEKAEKFWSLKELTPPNKNNEILEDQFQIEDEYEKNFIELGEKKLSKDMKADLEYSINKERIRLKEEISDEEKFRSVKIFLANAGILTAGNLKNVPKIIFFKVSIKLDNLFHHG